MAKSWSERFCPHQYHRNADGSTDCPACALEAKGKEDTVEEDADVVWCRKMVRTRRFDSVEKLGLERIANRLSTRPQSTVTEEMIEAGNSIIERMSSTYRARNGRQMSIQGEDGEMCWIVHSDDIETLRHALSKVSPLVQGAGPSPHLEAAEKASSN